MNRAIHIVIFISLLLVLSSGAKPETIIHTFVALCDNQHQGIIPVPEKLGNGQDPSNNLYWGAMYGVKSYFKNSKNWTLLYSRKPANEKYLERCVFRHKSDSIIMIADAYDGEFIKECIGSFFRQLSGIDTEEIVIDSVDTVSTANASLIAYIGHNGLMEFDVALDSSGSDGIMRDAIILACASEYYFRPKLNEIEAYPVLWTTGLMAPEAYTLEAAIEAWRVGKKPEEIRDRAAEAYSRYQNCPLSSAKRLFSYGF